MFKGINRGPSPSDSVTSAAAVGKAIKDDNGPRYGRPSDRYGPPTALFSEPLALLKYDLEHLEQFIPDDSTLDNTFEFVVAASDSFNNESQRAAVLNVPLENLLPGDCRWQKPIAGGSAKPHGVWLSGPFAYLILELKNEPGLDGDPFLQGLVVYSKVVAQEAVRSPIPHISKMVNHLSGLIYLFLPLLAYFFP
jgi:hypothetical protein